MVEFVSSDFGDDFSGRRFRGWATAAFNGRRCASSGGESGPAAVCRAVGARARWVGRVRSAGFPETIFRVGGRGVGQLRRCNSRRCASSGGESGPAADRCGADAHTRRRVGVGMCVYVCVDVGVCTRLWAAAAGTHTHTHTRTHAHTLTHSLTHTHTHISRHRDFGG